MRRFKLSSAICTESLPDTLWGDLCSPAKALLQAIFNGQTQLYSVVTYIDTQNKAIKEYARLYEKIDCDYETRDNYVYSTDERKKIETEAASLDRLGMKAEQTWDRP